MGIAFFAVSFLLTWRAWCTQQTLLSVTGLPSPPVAESLGSTYLKAV